MEAFFILVAFVLVLVPVVLPIVSFLTARGARTRVLTLERQLQEQERALDAMKGELAALRRESRPAAGAAVAANEAGAARTQPAAPLPIGPPAAARPPVVPPEVLPAPHVTPVLSPPVERPAATPPAALAPPPPPSRVEPRVPASPAPAAAAAGLRPGAAAAGAAPSGAEVRGPAAPRGAPPPPRPPVPPAAPPRSAPAFDWENLVGVKLFATMAGVALVIGAVFFLRHSIDQGWLQPPVRVLIGIISAIALLVGCEMKAARKYPATANALDAAAIAILFATFFAAYALWDLIPGGLAFVLLGLVTALAVLLSIRRDSLFIAVLGLLGGFATPILLSTGENRPIPLFAYLLLLNVGLAWIAYRNTWPILTVLTLVFTTLYQWGWVLRYLDAADLPLAMAIFLVFPVVTFAGVLVRRPGRDASGTLFQQTAVGAAVVPILFAVFLAAVPAYGVHAALFFGFLLLIDTGLLAVAAARQQRLLRSLAAAATVVAFAVWLGQSYVSDARLTVLAFTALFVLLFLLAEPVAARFGLFADSEQRVAHYAAPILLFVFPGGLSLALPHLVVVVLQLASFSFKLFFFCWLQIMIRWTLPRFRYDQLMRFGWLALLPIALLNVMLTAVIILAFGSRP